MFTCIAWGVESGLSAREREIPAFLVNVSASSALMVARLFVLVVYIGWTTQAQNK